jgi:hypothetical protein
MHVFDIETFISTQKQVMESMTAILKMYGLELNMEKIDVEPSDCENCIDFVYRLRCASEAICEALKEQ